MIFNGFVIIKIDRTKCHECDAFFAVNWQQDAAPSSKMASSPWLLSVFHCLMMVINITFFKLLSKFI